MSAELDQFLRDLDEDGVLDSTGEMTVDWNNRLEKLTSIVGLEPNLFLGRLLQAATVSKARSIRYTLRHNKIQIDIEPSNWQPYLLFHRYLEGKGLAPTPGIAATCGYLEQALLMALALKPRAFVWTLLLSKGVEVNLLRQFQTGRRSRQTVRSSHHRQVIRILLVWPAPVSWQERIREWLQGRVGVVDFINRHCRFSTIPTYLDGCHCRVAPPTREGSNPVRAVAATYSQPTPQSTFNLPAPSWAYARRLQLMLRQNNGASVRLDEKFSLTDKSSPARPVLELHQVHFLVPSKVHRVPCYYEPTEIPHPHRLLSFQSDQDQRLAVSLFVFEAPQARISSALPEHQIPYAATRFLVVRQMHGEAVGANTGLVLVKDGLAIRSPELPHFWQPGWQAIICIPDCKLDAEQWSVIEDERWHGLMAELREQFGQLTMD